MAKLEAIIGLEIHAELKTRTKMFCVCKNDPNETHPNVNICPVCMGHPGTLPVPNAKAIALTQRVGAALGCEMADVSKFDRKNYFYPDMPKGYQISQYDMPLCGKGELKLSNGRTIGITRIHLEEDTGSSQHPEGKDYSSVDFNRAGRALMELVTEPDLRSSEDVELFAQELQRILRYVGASDANMEKGEMRVEVNLSLRPAPDGAGPRESAENRRTDAEEDLRSAQKNADNTQKDAEEDRRDSATFGTKVEVKNLNSVRSARLAVAYEISRQGDILEDGREVVQETRGWHDTKQKTFSQREKEDAHDYRYFPEPDIPPFAFSAEMLDATRRGTPELPAQRRKRFKKEYGLTNEEIATLVDDKAMGEYYEAAISELMEWAGSEDIKVPKEKLMKLAANYLLSDLRGILLDMNAAISDTQVTQENFAELVKMVAQEKITSRVAKDVLLEMASSGQDPSDIVEASGLMQVSDEGELFDVAKEVIAENEKAASDLEAGKDAALKFLVGRMMAKTRGKANPRLAAELLKKAAKG